MPHASGSSTDPYCLIRNERQNRLRHNRIHCQPVKDLIAVTVADDMQFLKHNPRGEEREAAPVPVPVAIPETTPAESQDAPVDAPTDTPTDAPEPAPTDTPRSAPGHATIPAPRRAAKAAKAAPGRGKATAPEMVFASDLAAGKLPSLRRIRTQLKVGQPKAQAIQAQLAESMKSPVPVGA